MTADIEDPFALPSMQPARQELIRGGRYQLPWKDGTPKPRGFQRVSNLVSAYSDQYALRLWEIGEVLAGISASGELRDELVTARVHELGKDERRAYAEAFIEQAKDVSGGNVAAKHGTAMHALVEAYHGGLPVAGNPVLADYELALQRHKLTALPGMQERRVLVEELEVVGTLDNVLAPDHPGMNYIADLKTQRRFWTWLEIAAQLACYAHADAMWDAEQERWVEMPPVDRDIALVLWMPRDAAGLVEVFEVDIQAGWRTARRAYEVVQDRAAGKSVSSPRGRLRVAPALSATEEWAARFAACGSLAEGRALVRRAVDAGVWNDVLADCARRAKERLAISA